MRILQISSAKHFGGGERHLADLAKGLRNRGHDVFLAVAPGSPILESVPDHPSENILQLKIRNAVDLLAARKLAGFIRKNRIDIVHAHTGKDYLPASLAVRFAPKSKLVITRHVLFPLKTAHRFLLGNVSRAIAVSSSVGANLQKTFPPGKIALVPNGIETGDWANSEREKLGKEFRFENNIPFDAEVVGTVGELKHLKGQQDFILAAQLVGKRRPDSYFIIVGKDNSIDGHFRRELKRLAKVFNLEQRFVWFDWIEDTKPLLSALDIFVSPSHSESFGLAILEAMSTGCAVIATATDGAEELIEHGKNGILAPIKDPTQLADAISAILEDRAKLAELGRNAQQHAAENFGLERMITETEQVYLNARQ